MKLKLIKREPGKAYLDSVLWIPRDFVNIEGLKKALTFEFVNEREASALCLYSETEHHLIVPREFWNAQELPYPVVDCRPTEYPKVEIRTKVILDGLKPHETTQRDAMKALLGARGGTLQLSCGLGKTVIALDFIARRGVPALVILDNTNLLEQWKKEAEAFLEIPDGIGRIQADVFDWKKPLVFATYHTLANRAATLPEEVRKWFGTIVWDEGHHLNAETFSRSADLFYGYRLILSATPTRADGRHVIADHHVGPIIHKNLSQDLKPDIRFLWTGFSVDTKNPLIANEVLDSTGELHLGLLAGYFGRWRERLTFILDEVRRAKEAGRKILVLSNSIDENINLLALWNGRQDLYTDIPMPDPEEVGETVPPRRLDTKTKNKLNRALGLAKAQLKDQYLNPVKRENLEGLVHSIETQFTQDECARKVESLYRKRQKQYLKELLEMPSDAGLMISAIKPEERSRIIKEKTVTFAITKYGKEGLNERSLDTAMACEPMSDRNILQQFLGRVLRHKEGKKQPVVIFFEDDVGPMIAICSKIRGYLRSWPHEEAGPYAYQLIGHPKKGKASWRENSKAFGY